MAFCDPNCEITVPQSTGTSCNPTRRKGGIPWLLFAACNVDTTDLFEDLPRLQALAGSCRVRLVGSVLGSKGADSVTTRRLNSCGAEEPIAGSMVFTITDNNADNVTFKDITFWNTIRNTPSKYQIGYITCENIKFGFYERFASTVSFQIEDNSETGLAFHQGDITIPTLEIGTPETLSDAIMDILIANQGASCASALSYVAWFDNELDNSITFTSAGGSGTVDIKVERYGCNGVITPVAGPLPVGITSVVVAPIAPGSDVTTATVSSGTPGTYVIPFVLTGCTDVVNLSLTVIVT